MGPSPFPAFNKCTQIRIFLSFGTSWPEKCLVARLWFVVLVFGPVSGAVFRYLFGGAHSEYSRPRTQKVRPKMGAEMGPRSGPKTKVRGPLQNHPTALFAMREQRTSPGQNAHSDFDSELDITG